MNKAEDIEQLIYRELPPDRYCYIHNFIVEKDKEIERLNKRVKECEEAYLRTRHQYSELENKYLTDEHIINELEKWLNNEITRIQEIDKKSKVKRYGIEQQLDECAINRYMQTKDKIKELKGDSSNE